MEKERRFGPHIVQTAPDDSFCAGCATCEIACGLIHEGAVSPSYNRIFLGRDHRTMVHTIYACQQCEDQPCYEKCPKKDEAMCIDERGVVYINEEACIGCGLCRKACVMDPPRINLVKSGDRTQRKAKKCDLCRGREEGPACVQWCPVRCLYVSGGEEQ